MHKQQDKSLLLFTSQYPYGQKSETFLESEIIHLSKAFEFVYIFPFSKSKKNRSIPKNCIVCDDLIINKSNFFEFLTITFIHFPFIFKVLIEEIKYKKNKKSLLFCLSNIRIIIYELRLSFKLKKFLEFKNISDFICYNYWFYTFLIGQRYLKEKKIIKKVVSRAHGFDIYNEQWNNEYGIPLSFSRFHGTDIVCPISKDGYNTLVNHYPDFKDKIITYKLGIENNFDFNFKNNKKTKRIVSCSSIYPLKQVDYIARLIFSLKENIEWVHFGDGTDFELVKSITLSAPKNIKCKLMGYVNNQNVMKYYSSNNIDLFISSSKSEGLPVSMMEAISFGIPILAKKVGGVGEIVIDEVTGFCMNPNSTFHEDCNLLLKAINYKFNRNIITNFYSENYNGENNFTKFIQEQLINNSCAE